MTNIVAVASDRSHVLTEEGDQLDVVQMLDAQGDETDDPDEAMVVIVRVPNGRFGVVDLSYFTEKAAVH
jgi:hypothetical protein